VSLTHSDLVAIASVVAVGTHENGATS